MCFVHGDFCLSNIMYDLNNRIIKLIDPRGYFGELSVYGDIKYDIAKLRHSFCSYYDFIVADLFNVKEVKSNSFNFQVNVDDRHNKIATIFDKTVQSNKYNLEMIKVFESLLFFSMLPLHSDNFERQKAMYLTGIELINSTTL